MDVNEELKLTYSFDELPSDQRLRELIIYISMKCMDDPGFGATKLNKILYFADTIAFRTRGIPITGVEYMKLGRGPVPKHLVPIRDKMIDEGDIVLIQREYFGHEQHRTIPLREPDLGIFDAEAISIVDEVVYRLFGENADVVSELSHGIAWRVPEDHESIPYEAAFLSNRPLDEDDTTRANELISQYSWDV
jgi:hypothetical protein